MTDHGVPSEISALASFLTQMFEHWFPHEDAAFITETLIDSDRRGIASHGLQRVAWRE